MCTVGLYDTIEMRTTKDSEINLVCDRADVPIDGTNLIVRAGQALDGRHGAAVNLQKKIPLGGGLGGGSSNAAVALRGFNELWNLNHSDDDLAKMAIRLGSDVPFFLHGPSSICAGRGERVLPIVRPLPRFAVLIFPKFSMSTAAVYQKFDEMNLGSNDAITNQPDWNAWTRLSAAELMKVLTNDLETPAFALQPELAELRQRIEHKIGRVVRMSGSGSTLFTLADGRAEAESIIRPVRLPGIKAGLFDLAPKHVGIQGKHKD